MPISASARNNGGNCHTSTLIKLENEGLKGTVVNRVSPLVRPFAITMTVPLEVKPFDFALFNIYKRLRPKMFENDDQLKCCDHVKILNCIVLVRRRGSSWLCPGEFIRRGDCISGEGGGNSYHSFQVNLAIQLQFEIP